MDTKDYMALPARIPFRFERNEYFSAEELARAFAESDVALLNSSSYLSYIQRWFESNMMFEEAANMGNYISDPIPERGLLRFVYRNAKRPFSLFGRLTAPGNLEALLRRAADGEASETENRVVKMLGNGQIAPLYDEYAKLSGEERDEFFYNLLLLMEGKTPREQLECFNVLHDPETYLWPESVKGTSQLEVLDALRKIGAVPLRRDELKTIESEFFLPKELLFMLGRPNTYAQAAGLLNRWKTEGLLLPRDKSGDREMTPSNRLLRGLASLLNTRPVDYERQSLDEYARIARERLLGHTTTSLENIDFIASALQALPSPQDSRDAQNRKLVIERIRKLKETKITRADSLFMSEITRLLEFRKAEQEALTDGLLGHIIDSILGKNNYYLNEFDRRIAEACAAYLSKISENLEVA